MKRRTNITAGKISLSIFWTFFSLFFLYTFTCCTGCAESNNRKNGENSVAENILNEIALNWFYFDGTGALVRAENPSLIPAVEFKPWTEAVSVLDAVFSGQEPVLLVNKMGLLSSSMVAMSGSSVVFPNAEKLSSGTAASLASENGKTYIRFYRNSVFSRNPLSQPVSLFFCTDSAPFLIAGAVYADDFGAKKNSQCVSLNYTGNPAEPWAAAFKSSLDNAGGVLFEYLAFSSLPLSSGFESRVVSAGDFQTLIEKNSKARLPEAFSGFVSMIPGSHGFSLKISGKGFPASRTFVSGENSPVLNGCGFLTDKTAAALFSDGTLYIAPADNADNASGIKCIRLPSLNGGYIYTSFIISGEKILAGWEERRFYETGRSGILEVTLNPEYL